MDANLLKRITVNPGIFNGKPIIRDLRIKVENVLALLEQGLSFQDIINEYPDIDENDIRSCLLFAIMLVKNEEIYGIELEKSI